MGLAQPPKSSSATTVGVGFVVELCIVVEDEPQPPPRSLAVNVSGTFIMEEVCCGAAGAGGEAGSFVLQALLPPQGSIPENIFGVLLVTTGAAFDSGCCGCGFDERLKTEDILPWLGGDVMGGGEVVVVAAGDDIRSNISLEELGGAAVDFFDPMVAPIMSKLSPVVIEGLEACGGFVSTFWGGSSNRLPPPLDKVGEVNFGAAGGDFGLVRVSKLEKLDCFCVGGDVVEGKLKPLKASVKPPKASF